MHNDCAQVSVFPAGRSGSRTQQRTVYGDQDVRSQQVQGGPFGRPPLPSPRRNPLPPGPPTPGRYQNVPVGANLPGVNSYQANVYGRSLGQRNPYLLNFNDPFVQGANNYGAPNHVPFPANGAQAGGGVNYLAQPIPAVQTPVPVVVNQPPPVANTNVSAQPIVTSPVIATTTPSDPSTATTTTSTTTGMDALAQFIDSRSRTPIMPLTVFDGSQTKWKKWWAIFSYAVHNNATMDKTQKMLHLVANVSGEAALIIEPADADEEKYELCIKSLKKRYERPQDTRRNLVERLQEIPRCSKDVKEIRDTYTRVRSGFDCLNSLEDNEKNTLMLELVKQKFPENVQTKIGKWVHELGTDWTMTKMLEKMENFVIAEEAGKPKSVGEESRITTLPAILPQQNYQQRPSRSTSRPSYGNNRERSESRARHMFNFKKDIERPVKVEEALLNKGCGLCEKEGHHAVKCRSILDPLERRRIVNKNKLCYGCLSANHIARDCVAGNCSKCSGKHHFSLCMSGRDQSAGRYSKSPVRELRGEERPSHYKRDGSSFQQAPRTTPPS